MNDVLSKDEWPIAELGRFKGAMEGCLVRVIDGIPGPEDIVIDRERGYAYVSSQLRVPGRAGAVNGAIFRLDLSEDLPRPVNVTGELEEKLAFFHPHGMDLFIGSGGERSLFVINHRSDDDHCVEVFGIDGAGALRYLQRVSDEHALVSPNDIVALSEHSFLVVNDHGFRSKPLKFIEDVVRLCFNVGLGSVVELEFDSVNTSSKVLAKNIGLGAGIEVDRRPRPERIYVTSASARTILVYRREGQQWFEEQTICLDSGPDNLSWDNAGDLWVAGHPDPLAYSAYMAGWRKTSPSRLYRITSPSSPDPVVEAVFADDGELLSAASVATVYNGPDRRRLLIGAVAGRRILLADLN